MNRLFCLVTPLEPIGIAAYAPVFISAISFGTFVLPARGRCVGRCRESNCCARKVIRRDRIDLRSGCSNSSRLCPWLYTSISFGRARTFLLSANVHRYVGDCQKKRPSATPVIIPGVPSGTDPNLQTAHTLLPTCRGNSGRAAGWTSNGSARSRIGRTLALTGRGTSVLTAGWIFSGFARSRIGWTLARTG